MKYQVISKRKLRIRKTEGGKVIGYLKPKTVIEVDKYGGKWSHVKGKGYVATRLIKKVVYPQPTPKPTPTPTPKKTNAEKLAELATKYAYTTDTSKADYPKGKPTDAYKKALDIAYPQHKKWKAKPWQVGASCGVFVGTCVRMAGIDKDFPHYTSKQWKPFGNTKKWTSINPKKENIQDGDIFIYRHGKGGHIGIFVGGKVKEASYGDFYPKTTNAVNARLNPKNKSKLRVYRAKG